MPIRVWVYNQKIYTVKVAHERITTMFEIWQPCEHMLNLEASVAYASGKPW